ncbi:MAG: TRAP transporter substrate-binding protein [Rhodocyclaceae bacterium]|jgi:TRAP-type C4-dicarboxylate transport system substrate-binding protein|nr:TRAP transporter substrate-binding protein [Rhodocyclaceae bacterium]MBZ0132851.1 TRAP transporter substrate-binding protein [Rhodocyclaceae bacterium]MCO5099077.1 TRAP transporter substrate-binding protein [Rhodocyclaceae bacterium]MCP5296526.1 TRAP transporter substrate-binding protein [Zoogloeaceae bacterium]MCW5595130.1 TRAP transporter substrate-binding protein [Rhodocyclaceae bacterium]
MKKLATLAATLLAGALISAPAQSETTLTMSSWLPPSHIITKDMMMGWAKQVESATQGRVKVRLLPKAVTSPPGTFDAVRDGLADVSLSVHGYTPGRFPMTKMAEFPFLGDSAEAISVAYWRTYMKHMAKLDEHKGLVLLGLMTHGPGQIYMTKQKVTSLSDLANQKIRVGGGVVVDVTKAIGAVPLLKPASETYEVLKSGIADGIFFPKDSVPAFKLVPLINHMTVVPGGLYNVSFGLWMNEAKFKGLSKADQDAIMKVSGENYARMAGKVWDREDAAGLKLMQEGSIIVRTASPELVAEIKAKTDPLEKAWYDQAKAKGIDGPAVMAEFRAEIQKLSGK